MSEQEFRQNKQTRLLKIILGQHYRSMQNLMKLKITKEIRRAKKRIDTFKKRLQETMACWP